jgi:hypothetical protein
MTFRIWFWQPRSVAVILIALLCATTALFSATAHAQVNEGGSAKLPVERRLPAISAARLAAGESVELDGKHSEAFWQRVAPIGNFFEYRPKDSLPAKFKSEARIVFDQQAMYIALTAFDSEPDKIDAPLVRRDEVFGSQDFFAIHIDPIGSRKFAQIFRVNASGSIGDGLYSEDAGSEDFSPDFEWQSATARTAQGWTAEMRIPFSTLRYSSPPSSTWSIQVIRGIARDQVYRFANAEIPRDTGSFLAYAQTLEGMNDLPAGREFVLTPQLTWRRAADRVNGVGPNGKSDFVIGADIKFRPRPDLVFDATINPDFSQVELDTPQLAANAQFALFFPEKRPFFLEGADILSTPISAIYTRSISDPAWGTRVTQRKDGFDFVFLTARDDGKGPILLPGSLGTGIATQDSKSQATIVRTRVNIGSLTVGALVTDRTYEKRDTLPQLSNRVGGADVVWRPTGELRVRAQVLASDTRDERNRARDDDLPQRDSAVLADYNYRDQKWNLSGGVQRVGKGFRADNGFVSQAGYVNAYQEFQRKWSDVGVFNEISPFFNVGQKRDLDGRVLDQRNHVGVYVGLPRSTGIVVEWHPRDLVRARTEGAPLKRDQLYMNIESNPGKTISYFFAELLTGERLDVANNRITDGYFFNASATIRLSDRWEIEPRIDNGVLTAKESVAGAKRILLERAVQLKSVYHLSSRDTIRLIGQYNGVRRSKALFESPNVSPFEKTETLSVVYGHRRGLGTSFYVGATASRTVDPSARFTRRQNEVFAKWSWAFDASSILAGRTSH